jgi:DNA-binding Xre family transcriptional regulator
MEVLAMAVEWRLREVMTVQGITNASQLQAALEKTLGIHITRVALDKLIKKEPKHIKLETMQYLCDLFQVSLDELLIITPEPVIRRPSLVQPFGKKENPTEALMVDPSRFF